MEDLNWATTKQTTSFKEARDNMAYDKSLLEHLKSNERVERYYQWQTPGITYSFKQQCPDHLTHIDHSIRITGGGIVFHSPGDVVFCIASHQNDPHFPKKPKDKLHLVSNHIKQALILAKVPLDQKTPPSFKDHAFCQSYPTPFELSVHGQKICGLTIRQFKTKWLIQGVIHASNTHSSLSMHMDNHQIIHSVLNSNDIHRHLINASF